MLLGHVCPRLSTAVWLVPSASTTFVVAKNYIVRLSLNPPALPLGAIVAIKPEAASAAAMVSLDPVVRLITCPPPPTAVAAVSAAACDGVGSVFEG